jgi:hypothetical protein
MNCLVGFSGALTWACLVCMLCMQTGCCLQLWCSCSCLVYAVGVMQCLVNCSYHAGPMIQDSIICMNYQLFWLVSMAVSGESLVSEAVNSIESVCHASGALSKAQMLQVDCVAEIAKHVLLIAVQELIQESSGGALLSSKSADGTPISVRLQHRLTLPSSRSFTRSGRECVEYLLMNQFFRGRFPSGAVTRVLLQDPVKLCYGKGADAIFQSCLQNWKSLRQLGHSGISIEHYCYDRCGIDAHERLWRQWHAMKACSFDHLATNVPVEILRLTEFILVTPCAAHDAQSAFRWGMRDSLTDKDLLRDVYVSIESLRNSMDLLVRHIGEWSSLRLSFAEPHSFQESEQWRVLWQALDVELETVELLSDTLQLRFLGGRLYVSSSCSGRPDLTDLVMSTLLSVWKFVRFTESRFLTTGSSSRTMIAALLLGLEDMVQFIVNETNSSKFYLNGFSRLVGDRKTFMAQAAFISRVTDGVLAELLEDARVARRHDELWQTLSEDLKWLIELPSFVW